MTRTMPNGKTFLQNLDGMLTFRANLTLLGIAIRVFLVIFFLGCPVYSFLLFLGGEYVNDTAKFQPLKEEFLSLEARRENMGYLDFCEKVYELDEKWSDLIATTEGEDTFSYSPLWWMLFPVWVTVMYLYYRMCRHYWRTPFRILHLPYLLVNGAFVARFFTSFEGTGLSNSVFAFYAYNYTPGYYFWHAVNAVMFVFYIAFYFAFMFGRPEPESRKHRCLSKLYDGELPLADLLW